jgi:diguanylate cyclase (GGDEF)-like protein
VAAENRARVLADWRSNLQMSLWVFLPLLAGLLAATLMMVRQRFSAIRSMEARTQAEVSRLAQLIDSLPDAVVVLGRGGFPLHGNPEWRRFTGEQHDHDSLLSLYRTRAGDRPVTESWLAKLSRVLQGSQTHAPPEELSLFDADGQPRVYQLTVQRLTDSADTVVLVQHDLTDSHAHAHKLRYLSSHDELTGLYNRACFNELLAQSLEHALPLAVLFVDLDHFKDINDAQGHQTGDQILIKAARRIQQSVRPTDIVGRYGGDEFVVVLSAPALPALAERVAGRLNQQLSMPFEVDWRSFQVLQDTAMRWRVGNADAGRDLEAAPIHFKRHAQLLIQAASHPFRQRGQGWRTQHHDKFVAAIAADNIGWPHRLLDAPGGFNQDLVTGLVPLRVIDVLEMIQIDKQHSQG